MQNLRTKCFILVNGFKNIEYFHFFSIVKMATKYAKNDMVGNLEVFNKFHLFKIVEIFPNLLWNFNNLQSIQESKNYFF